MASMKQLLAHPRVHCVDDDRRMGGGIFVTLKRGFTIDEQCDVRCFSEDTITDALAFVRSSTEPFAGPYVGE